MAARGPKMADGVWKGVHPYVLERSLYFSVNKFFDLSTPSMRKGHDGEKKRKRENGGGGGMEEEEKNDEKSGH